MAPWIADTLRIAAAVLLVLINAFFVAAEFALVKVRPSRVDILVKEKRPFAKTVQWLVQRLDASLSACQLGITMASLGLGWIGEPAVAHFVRPVFVSIGIQSAGLLHAVSFVIAFSIITSAHLVFGEQAPKMFAIRRPERLALWCAAPLKFFYYASYPFLHALNQASTFVLSRLGIRGESTLETYHSEEELRVLLEQARLHGEIGRSEHQLLNAVFEFDDLLARQIMIPRGEIACFDLERPWTENYELVKSTQHSRYPVCTGSLDHLKGVIHLKDLVGKESVPPEELISLMRPPQRIPETMPISNLLRHFQRTQQHLAFVIDEHDTIVGAVTLENVLEQIVGPVEDEFDKETRPMIVDDGPRRNIVLGSTHVDQVEKHLGIELGEHTSDTLSGLVVERLGRFPTVGDRVEWKELIAEVLEVQGLRAERIHIEIRQEPPSEDEPENEEIQE